MIPIASSHAFTPLTNSRYSQYQTSSDEDASSNNVAIPPNYVSIKQSHLTYLIVYAAAITFVLLLTFFVLLGDQRLLLTSPEESDSAQTAAIHNSVTKHSPLVTELQKLSPARFLVLTDLHLEPHYDPRSFQPKADVCRAQAGCDLSDWEAQSGAESSRSTNLFPYGRYRCDPSLRLLKDSFKELHSLLTAQESTLDFIMVLGDFSAHYSPCPLTHYLTIDEAIRILTTSFPRTPLIPSIGNSDVFALPLASIKASITQDWQSTTEILSRCPPPFSSLLSIYLRNGIINQNDSKIIRSFCSGGYYSRAVNGVRIIVLNTVAFSSAALFFRDEKIIGPPRLNPTEELRLKSYLNSSNLLPPSVFSFGSPSYAAFSNEAVDLVECSSPLRTPDPYDQFLWLEKELESAASMSPPQTVYIAGHIPPGIKEGINDYFETSWCPQYQTQFSKIVGKYTKVVMGMFYGDYSEDMIRFLQMADVSSSPKLQLESIENYSSVMFIHGGMTPRKDSNPVARVYGYDQNRHNLLDYVSLYINLHKANEARSIQWDHEYTFLETFQLPNISLVTLLSLYEHLVHKPDLLSSYARHINGDRLGKYDYVTLLCDMIATDLQANEYCRQSGNLPTFHIT